MDEALLAEHVDAIHGVSRDDFVAERDRRVRQLRADGHRDEADALKSHRKPTVPAWAVNQLARRDAATVDELVQAGGELRRAQLRATSGKGADGLRPATHRVRDLATDLARSARDILDGAGAAAGHLDEVEQTLFAAAIDPSLQETLCRGIFSRPVEAAGFGVMAGLAAVPDDPEPATDEVVADQQDTEEAEDAEAAEARALQRRREEEQARREAHRRALEQQRGDLQQSLVRQQRRAERARARADELQSRADAADADAREDEQEQARIAAEVEDVDEELAALDADEESARQAQDSA